MQNIFSYIYHVKNQCLTKTIKQEIISSEEETY